MFLDLAGTLVQQLKPGRLDQTTLIPGVVEAVARLSSAGFVCPGVTVQSRIAKGLWSLSEFEIWFASFAAELHLQVAFVVAPYGCPHRLAEPCPYAEHRLYPADCLVIGDSPVDMRAARCLGARESPVHTGRAADPAVVEEAGPDASIVVNSLAEPADWILIFQ